MKFPKYKKGGHVVRSVIEESSYGILLIVFLCSRYPLCWTYHNSEFVIKEAINYNFSLI